MAYVYSPSISRYRDRVTGRLVSRATVRATLDIVLDVQMGRIQALSEQLIANEVDLPTWRATMSEALKTAHLEGAAVARGGWTQLTQGDFEWTGQRVREQLGYVQRFHDDLASGAVPMDATVASRAEMYIEAGRSTQREMERRMAVGSGADLEKNIGGDGANSCGECSACSAQGWVPIGSLPAVGARPCLSRCHCYLLFKTTP